LVLDQVCSGTKPVYELKTKQRALRLTAEHPVLVGGPKRSLWVPLRDVLVGDSICIATVYPESRLASDKDFEFDSVVSIELDGEEPVYDIEVADAGHNFVAEGIVVHNSVLEPARWVWKRLVLLEDAALIYRLQRAPERFAFYVDTGNLPPNEALRLLHQIRQQYKKKKFFNPITNEIDLKFSALPVAHDTPIPLLDGRALSISEMASEYEAGKEHWVYSIDRTTRALVPGKVSWVGKTRVNGRALKVTFDDGGSAVMAPDHPVMRRDGSYVNAEDLIAGDSVMPLYRRVSKGKRLPGYERVYDPETNTYKCTHRVVAGALGLRGKGELVHHRDFGKLNNDPSNLEGMQWRDHLALHREHGHKVGQIVAKLRQRDVVLDQKLREASRRNITAYNKSAAKRRRTSELNKQFDTAQYIRAYNASEKHARDNEIRRAGKRQFWADPKRAQRARANMRIRFPSEFVEGLEALVRRDPTVRAEGLVRAVNANKPLLEKLRSANTRTINAVHRHLLLKVYRKEGFDSFAEFKQAAVGRNHTVVAVEEVDPCDHYCMTVEKWHNFALLLKDEDGAPIRNSGVFVKNSQDEDFFVPVINGSEATRIDVLSGPNWQCLAADTKIPLLDGTSPTIEEMTKRGGEFWVYSVSKEGKVVPGRARAARKTHDAAEIWEVGLDNGEVVRCTGNHPFLLRDGKWSLAEHLREGDSLMPLHRKTSTHPSADGQRGYEKVYDPASGKWLYTHHAVFADRIESDLSGFFREDQVIHHSNGVMTDNRPENLVPMTRKEHFLHHSPWTPERKAKHRSMMIERMADKVLRAEKSRILTEWNKSEARRERITGATNPRWRDLSVADLGYLVLATGARNHKELMARGRVSQSVIARVLAAEGLSWRDFASKNIPGWIAQGRAKAKGNHKVVFVRKTSDREPVYDLTVDEHANFAVSSGVFVSNSMDDVEYFLNKMFAAVLVPKAYLAQEEGVNRAILSSEDVRFARTIMRVQQSQHAGIEKICRVHLAAIGIPPDHVEFYVRSTVPNSIFELAQLEVRNARADLMSRMREHVSLHWCLENAMGLSEAEIKTIMDQRDEETIQQSVVQGTAEAAMQKAMGVSPEQAQEMRIKSGRSLLSAQGLPLQKGANGGRHLIRQRTGGISEQELFDGSKEGERRSSRELARLVRSNSRLARQMKEVSSLVQGLHRATARRR
jgi:intein/homing endonuclease